MSSPARPSTHRRRPSRTAPKSDPTAGGVPSPNSGRRIGRVPSRTAYHILARHPTRVRDRRHSWRLWCAGASAHAPRWLTKVVDSKTPRGPHRFQDCGGTPWRGVVRCSAGLSFGFPGSWPPAVAFRLDTVPPVATCSPPIHSVRATTGDLRTSASEHTRVCFTGLGASDRRA
jgi:hypothetical protein